MKKKLALVCLVILIYAIAKIYVLHTPTPHDDQIPDLIRDELLDVLTNDY